MNGLCLAHLLPFDTDITTADDGFHVRDVRGGGDTFFLEGEEVVADL